MLSFSAASAVRHGGIALLAVAWLVPNHYPPWGSFYNDSCAAAALALLVVGSAPAIGSGRVGNVVWPVVFLALIPAIQWGAGLLVYAGDAWMSTLYVLGLALAIGVGSLRGLPADELPASLAWAIVGGSLISSAMALSQAALTTGLGIWVLDALPGMRPYANLGQPNNLATLIGFGFAAVFFLFERRWVSVAAALAMSTLFLFGVSVTQSRTALLYGPFCFAVLWLLHRRGMKLRTRLPFIAGITAAQWFFTALWPALQTALLMAPSTSLGQRETGTFRFLVWPVLLDALSTRPWLGFGWQQVGAAELSAVDRHPVPSELWLQAHDVALDLALFNGLPIAAFACAAFVYWFVCRTMKAKHAASAAGILTIGILGIHSLLELPHHYAYFLVPAGLWAGIIERDQDAGAKLSARWLWPMAAIALVGVLTPWVDYLRIEEEFRLVRFEGAHIRTPAATEAVPSNPALSSLTAFLEAARTRPAPHMSATRLQAMRDSVERYPYAASLLRYAEALSLNGRGDEARSAFLKIRHLYGDAIYHQHRKELRDEIADGRADLLPLEQSLPN